jgi:hypothetical protein
VNYLPSDECGDDESVIWHPTCASRETDAQRRGRTDYYSGQSERVAGIEPAFRVWKTRLLPLQHTRLRETGTRRSFYSSRVLKEADVLRAFPAIGDIRDKELRKLSIEVWRYVSERNPAWTDIARLPLHPAMPMATHGNLVKHVDAMVRISEALVPIYRELWKQDLDLDTYRAASYIHDAAKVIEFSEKDGGVVGIPGYNHAVEAGRIVRELGGPEPLAHIVEAHSFAGALVVPRTRDAQLFLLIDPMCLNVFPEQGTGVVERHLKSNNWEDPRTLERYRSPS